MSEDDDFVRRIERLGISAEDREFLLQVRRQYEAEMAALAADQDKPDAPTADP